jgi:sporulation protein YlmC with PRC-barrel domain
MRTILFAAIIISAMLDVVSVRDMNSGSVDLAEASEDSTFGTIIGLEVYNNTDQDLARIEDIIIGKDGRVEAVILSVGEYLGLVAHFVSVESTALTIKPSRTAVCKHA